MTRAGSREPVLMCWSGGKDSAMALDELQSAGEVEIVALLTTVTEGVRRISMHGVRHELLVRQAAALGIPLHEVALPPQAANEAYEARMAAALAGYRAEGVRRVAFGDLFLCDVRAYRERQLARAGMQGLFPVWERNTRAFARDFLERGFRAYATCVDTEALAPAFAGRALDAAFFADLPAGVDPCGENGEFHSFVWDGPNFAQPVACRPGARHWDGRFCFRDLLPGDAAGAAQ